MTYTGKYSTTVYAVCKLLQYTNGVNRSWIFSIICLYYYCTNAYRKK